MEINFYNIKRLKNYNVKYKFGIIPLHCLIIEMNNDIEIEISLKEKDFKIFYSLYHKLK